MSALPIWLVQLPGGVCFCLHLYPCLCVSVFRNLYLFLCLCGTGWGLCPHVCHVYVSASLCPHVLVSWHECPYLLSLTLGTGSWVPRLLPSTILTPRWTGLPAPTLG